MLALGLMVPIVRFERPRADGFMGQHIVGQDQRVATHRMAEMKADACAF